MLQPPAAAAAQLSSRGPRRRLAGGRTLDRSAPPTPRRPSRCWSSRNCCLSAGLGLWTKTLAGAATQLLQGHSPQAVYTGQPRIVGSPTGTAHHSRARLCLQSGTVAEVHEDREIVAKPPQGSGQRDPPARFPGLFACLPAAGHPDFPWIGPASGWPERAVRLGPPQAPRGLGWMPVPTLASAGQPRARRPARRGCSGRALQLHEAPESWQGQRHRVSQRGRHPSSEGSAQAPRRLRCAGISEGL